MAKSSKGLIFVQNAVTGEWVPFDRFDKDNVQPSDIASMRVEDPANVGKSIILVTNWALESGAGDRPMPWAEKDMMIVLAEADSKRMSLPLCGVIKEVIKGIKVARGE